MKQPILLILILCMTIQIGWTQNNATTIAYIAQYKTIAMKEMKRTGVPASITLAQAIVESNSGESNLAKNHNNHFGIKCKSDWTGAKTYQDDDAKQECFRAYDAAELSFKDHSNFLKNRPNYVDLFLLDPVDDTAWAYGLKKAGYATASDYPKKLLKIIDDYELAQYNFPELANEIEGEEEGVKTPSDTPVTNVLADTPVKKTPSDTPLTNMSFIEIALKYNLPLYKLFEYNEIEASNLLERDQLIFLASKKKIGATSFHTVKYNTSLHEISQLEGVQLSALKLYNPKLTDPIKEGTQVLLFKEKENSTVIKKDNSLLFNKRKK